MKIRRVLLPVCIVMSVLVISCRPAQDLSLHLSTDQSTYHMNQRMLVVLTLQNSSSNNLLIQKRLVVNTKGVLPPVRDVFFSISTPSGGELEFDLLPNTPLVSPSDFLELTKGESISRSISLTTYYQFKEIGTYTVQAVYENQSDPGDGRTAWKGIITSNTVNFTIEP